MTLVRLDLRPPPGARPATRASWWPAWGSSSSVEHPACTRTVEGSIPSISTSRLSVARADDPPRGGRATRDETEGRDSDLAGPISRLYRGSTGLRYQGTVIPRRPSVRRRLG